MPCAALKPAGSCRASPTSAAEQAALWKIRAGIFPSVGAVRPERHHGHHRGRGLPHRAPGRRCVSTCTKLFLRHGYDERPSSSATPRTATCTSSSPSRFNDQASVDQYARFIDDVVELVVRALRRRAQGRARHRTQHGAVRRDGVGRRSLAHHEAPQGAGGSRQPAQPRRDHQLGPQGPPCRPQAPCRRWRRRWTSASSAATANPSAPAAS